MGTPGPSRCRGLCITWEHATHQRPVPLGPCLQSPPTTHNYPVCCDSFLTWIFHGNSIHSLRDASLKKLVKNSWELHYAASLKMYFSILWLAWKWRTESRAIPSSGPDVARCSWGGRAAAGGTRLHSVSAARHAGRVQVPAWPLPARHPCLCWGCSQSPLLGAVCFVTIVCKLPFLRGTLKSDCRAGSCLYLLMITLVLPGSQNSACF